MKVLISKIFYDNKNFNKTIDFMKVLVRWNIYKLIIN
jgi:hypothetical protein